MGIYYAAPPNVPSHVLPVCEALLATGGILWTICYALYVRESLRSKTYGMPLFALALNVSWDGVYALYVAEKRSEQVIFAVWVTAQCGLIYGLLRHGANEWGHAPVVRRRLGLILVVMVVGGALAHWSFAKWWIEARVGMKEGKYYRGVVGPDVSELEFITVAVVQAHLSVASLANLIIRQHSGGVSWAIWATRTLGTITGLYGNFGWAWYFWTKAHEYYANPFMLFLMGTTLVSDLVYPFVLRDVKRTERVLEDGRKVSGESMEAAKGKKA